jgi:hypothetical protein
MKMPNRLNSVKHNTTAVLGVALLGLCLLGLPYIETAYSAKPHHRMASPQRAAASVVGPQVPAASAVMVTPPATPAVSVTSIDLVRQPEDYLGKTVQFKGVFNSFSALGLDYKKALRDSKDFISVLVLRPDVNPSFKIPLSELKLFYPRKKSEAVTQLDAGDTVQITGTVFSTALGEPWVEISTLTIEAKAPGKTTASKTTASSATTPSDKPKLHGF